jgi:hypothetical protein
MGRNSRPRPHGGSILRALTEAAAASRDDRTNSAWAFPPAPYESIAAVDPERSAVATGAE